MRTHRISTLFALSCFLVSCAARTRTHDAPTELIPETDKESASEFTALNGKADAANDPCAENDWYGDGECDDFCVEYDSDCDDTPLGPEPSGHAALYPIVTVHGFAASAECGLAPIVGALEADGHTVYPADLPPFNFVATRAEHLAQHIDRVLDETGALKVNIIAHSMGGLDSRYLISTLGYGPRVASLTTISTPHRGTAVADYAFGAYLSPYGSIIMETFSRVFGSTFSDHADETVVLGALADLSEFSSDLFARENPDHPNVYYQSWAGVSSRFGTQSDAANSRIRAACQNKLLMHPGTMDHMGASFWLVQSTVAHGEERRPNDGLITVESARWGNFQGCFPADHLAEIGAYGVEPNSYTGYDPARFYRNLAFDLATRGY